jgi:histidinol phosphatase-like enzyme (inositol monophosphatase family)
MSPALSVDPTLISLALTLADAAGEVIRPLFRGDLQAEYKAASSPIVTIADREAERVMRGLIEQHYPDHNIFGEEFGVKTTGSRYTWVLDPVDGTIAFSTGKPLFGTLIALLDGDHSVLGIIDQPILKERWLGVKGQPTLLNQQPIRAKSNPELSRAYLSCTTPELFEDPVHQAAFERVSQAVHITSYGGDCYHYGLVAAGHLDLVVERQLALYDFAALIPIIEGSGGLITDWNGQPLTRQSAGDIVAAGDPSLHQQVVQLLQG